jgi:hypothetical protein
MRNQNRTKGLCLILAVALAGPLSALVWGAAFTATITISGHTAICGGESATLTAAWSTNKDVTRGEWYVDGEGQGAVSFPGTTSGTSEYTFDGTALGNHEITFRLWHHVQYANGRDASTSVTITVTEPQACECQCCGACQCQCCAGGPCECSADGQCQCCE